MIDTSDPIATRAEAERRMKLRQQGARTFDVPDPAPAEFTPRDASILEKTEQLEVRKRFVVCGFKVRNLSQPRATKQAPGLPDLWLVHRALPIAVWFETKRQVGGRYSDAQLEFRDDCDRCGVTWRGGDRYAAERYLVAIGLATWDANGTFEPMGRVG